MLVLFPHFISDFNDLFDVIGKSSKFAFPDDILMIFAELYEVCFTVGEIRAA